METIEYRNKITYLSFLLAFFIVLRHSVGIGVYESVSGWLYWVELFISQATDMIVPMFFALSGFLFFQNFSISKLQEKFMTRIRSVFIPFVVWSFIGFLFWFILLRIPVLSSHTNITIGDDGLTALVYEIFIDTKYNVTWFLRNLIVYIFVTPVFYTVLRCKMYGWVLVIVSFCLGYVLHNSVMMYAAPYLFGAYIGLNFKGITQNTKMPSWYFVVSIILLIISCIATVMGGGRINKE